MLDTAGPRVATHTLAALVLAGLVGTGCTDAQPTARPYGQLVPALCEALGADDAGVIDTAWSRAHGPLHDLADDATSVDRASAAELLVAKNAVEELLSDDAPTDELHAALDRLLERTRTTIRTLGQTPPTC